MIYKMGNCLTDGKNSKRIPDGFEWHSDMTLDRVPGEYLNEATAIPETKQTPIKRTDSTKYPVVVVKDERDFDRWIGGMFGLRRK